MPKKPDSPEPSEAVTKSHFVRCRYCGQKNSVRADYVNNSANCGKCKLPLSNEPHKKFADLNKHDYIHPADSKALAAPASTLNEPATSRVPIIQRLRACARPSTGANSVCRAPSRNARSG